MFSLMAALLAVFSFALIGFARNFRDQTLESLQSEFIKADDFLRQQSLLHEKILTERIKLENEAAQIFTLYEMTREITKHFKAHLKENVSFEDCRLINALPNEERGLQESKGYFIFPLKSKRERLGYLVASGLSLLDKEKFSILGHQFALALRRVKLYEEIEELAMTDSLTGAYTRRYLMQRFDVELRRALNRKIELSVLMIDVDHFKKINDQYGHLVGDQVLKNIGAIIKENIREIDLVCRYGGEEFCMILPDTDRDGASFAAERIRVAVEEAKIKTYDLSLNVTVSIGMATYPLDGKTTAELIDKSDGALYRAKKKGRNCICAFSAHEGKKDV